MESGKNRCVTIRRARLHDDADLEALAQLRWRWRVDDRGESGVSRAEFSRQFAQWCAGHADTHPAFLAERDGVVVGMAWLAIVERIPGPAHFERRSAYVQSVYVAPEAREAGVGSQLVAAVIDEARRRRLDYLAVHPSDVAFGLYRRAGFAETSRVLELDFRDG